MMINILGMVLKYLGYGGNGDLLEKSYEMMEDGEGADGRGEVMVW